MDIHQFFISVKAYGQAIDSILTRIKEVMPNRTNCFSRCSVRILGLMCKVKLVAIQNQAFQPHVCKTPALAPVL